MGGVGRVLNLRSRGPMRELFQRGRPSRRRNSKPQTPNSRQTSSFKHQTSKAWALGRSGIWTAWEPGRRTCHWPLTFPNVHARNRVQAETWWLRFGVSLELEVWSLEFRPSAGQNLCVKKIRPEQGQFNSLGLGLCQTLGQSNDAVAGDGHAPTAGGVAASQ
jgi:hypothetical protein